MPGYAMSGNIRGLFGRRTGSGFGYEGERWCQVSDGHLGAMGLIEEMKSPCGGRGFER